MGSIYFLIFWIPVIASALMLLMGSQAGLISRPGKLIGSCGLAFLMQLFAGILSPLWAIGLVLQVILAVYLAIKIKLG